MLERLKILILVLAMGQFLALSNANAKGEYTANECFEDVSRATLKFNMGLDRVLFKPIAKGYNKLIPEGLRDKYKREADIEKYLKNMDKLRQRGILS